MQKKEGMKPASGGSEKVVEVTPSRMSENVFLESMTDITFIQSYSESYTLYSFIWYKNCSWDYARLSLLENTKAANTTKKSDRVMGGQALLFCWNWGQAKEMSGPFPPLFTYYKGPWS